MRDETVTLTRRMLDMLPAHSRDIAAALDHDKRAVRNILHQLHTRGVVRPSGKYGPKLTKTGRAPTIWERVPEAEIPSESEQIVRRLKWDDMQPVEPVAVELPLMVSAPTVASRRAKAAEPAPTGIRLADLKPRVVTGRAYK